VPSVPSSPGSVGAIMSSGAPGSNVFQSPGRRSIYFRYYGLVFLFSIGLSY